MTEQAVLIKNLERYIMGLWSVTQLVLCISYIITVIVTVIVYSNKIKGCPKDTAVLGNRVVSAYQDECLQAVNKRFMAAWIIIAILGALLFLMLVIGCFSGKGLSNCFLAIFFAL